MRYHKQVYFPADNTEKLKEFVNQINSLDFSYSVHCLDNLNNRDISLKGKILSYIKDYFFNFSEIFEYYTANNDIIKACFRIPFLKTFDIILVLSCNKNIVTVYLNQAGDNHETLRAELYCRE